MSQENKNVDLSQFRLIPTSVIDSMIANIYNANKEQFDLYFELVRVKQMNVISQKQPDQVNEQAQEKEVVKPKMEVLKGDPDISKEESQESQPEQQAN